MSLFENLLPWGRISELAARALIAWDSPRSGLPKLQEECGELVTAVNQFNYGRLGASALAEEMADVLLMVVQGAHVVGESVFYEAFQKKFQRLGARLREHSVGCEHCGGGGEINGSRCPGCFAPPRHGDDCATRLGLSTCSCLLGFKLRLHAMQSVVTEAKRALERPDDDWLEEVFRDFAPELGVEEWRRRVYERCVAHHAVKVEVLRG